MSSPAQRDYRHLWHPYTDQSTYERQPHCSIERGEGVYLYDSNGNALLDGIASWWCVSLGHSHPKIVRAIQEQAAVLQQAILGGLSHGPAIDLAERIAGVTPPGLEHVYFAADGSSATEAALKMAVQYWQYLGEPQRTRFVALENGYHGDTLGAVAAGFTSWFQEPFGALVKPALLSPTPHAPTSDPEAIARRADWAAEELDRLVAAHAKEIAAMILEPLCQGAAGIWIYPERYLRAAREICDRHGILLIADEIAVGFGRTGAMFACEKAGIVPDILCIGKALTGGYLPLSAAVASTKVFDAFRSSGGAPRVFWDGHTYCGNPITCAAALAALDVFDELDLPRACAGLERQLAEGFARVESLRGVTYARTLGMIGMCTLETPALAAASALEARRSGLFIRPLGTSLYLWPPLTSTPEELGSMIELFHAAIEKAQA
jgi:adenosylmethionine-8-amino-7-oxononanoate aminotransferase